MLRMQADRCGSYASSMLYLFLVMIEHCIVFTTACLYVLLRAHQSNVMCSMHAAACLQAACSLELATLVCGSNAKKAERLVIGMQIMTFCQTCRCNSSLSLSRCKETDDLRLLCIGGIPPSWGEGAVFPALLDLLLASNTLNGTLPPIFPPALQQLELYGNQL
jgi:hypothetical protein